VVNFSRPDKDDLMDVQSRFVTIERPHALEPVTLFARPLTPLQALVNCANALALAQEWRLEALELRTMRVRDRLEQERAQEALADALFDVEQLRKRCEVQG
jgi:hypothetical protein